MLDTGQLKYAESNMLDLLVSSTGPKCTTNFMSFIYKPRASRHQSLVLTFPFYCKTNFQEFGMILHAEYDKNFLLISRTTMLLLIMPVSVNMTLIYAFVTFNF